VSGLVGQTVSVIFNNGQSYGPAVFSGFGSAGKSAVFMDAAGIRAEYLLATIANLVPQVQPAQTYVIETPVFYGGGYYGGGGHRGHRRHHGHHHGIGSYYEYVPTAPVVTPAILPVASADVMTLSSATGSMIAAMIPMALVALGIMGVIWLVRK
jgi:hypothetical protein